MSTSVMRPDCRKFAPNIFNKSKCTNCFKQKEEHSPEALESNRATRKVAKCGYLFVAPGWDFSNPLNRTKRWQRRWFVLYDDGELSYSVDEHPDTIPQASIDMNKVLEVTDAEEVTGNSFSLAITAPDHVHFVKGTSREECRWWMEVLSVFPRSKGRHKRNATFPGSQSASSNILPQSPNLRTTTPTDGRPRYNSVHSDHPQTHPNVQSWLPVEADVFPTRDLSSAFDTQIHTVVDFPTSAPDTRKAYRDQPATSASPPTRDKIQTEEKARTRRILNREKRGVKSTRSYSEDFSGMLPSWKNAKNTQESQDQNEVARRLIFEDDTKRDEKLKDIADSITRPRYRRNNQSRSPYRRNTDDLKPTRDGECSEEDEDKKCDRSDSPVNHSDSSGSKLVRGDPDGCGLDLSSHRYSPSSELRVDLPAEDLLNIKKGWLMKQGADNEWNKHWFVLRGTALMYYRDPSSEDKGIMDGVIDLSGVKSVTEVQVARNYGFQTVTWDDRKYILSAVTAGIRGNWMSAIRRAAGLQDPQVSCPHSVGEKLERDLEKSYTGGIQSPCSDREPPVIQTSRRNVLFSSDDEYRTASECGRRDSEDWTEPLALLPPSPPLNRTPISRVKEKARSRSSSRSRVFKRSKSSPPSSRHSTLDSVRSEDFIIACCGELPESDAEESVGMESVKSSLYDTVDSQCSEVEELRRQLNMALCEVSSAEKELIKLRQQKSEVPALEKQIKELLSTLEQTREQLQQKTKDTNELNRLRDNYEELLKEHDELLSQWRKQLVDGEWRERYHKLEGRFQETNESWEHKLQETEAVCHETSNRCDIFSRELSSSREIIQHLENEVLILSKRLAQGIEENESLYRRLRELEGRSGSNSSLSMSRERGRSMDSLSDLTNIDLDLNLSDMDKERIIEEYDDLRGRFEKAIQEIRAMKRELRESHAMYDELELQCISLRQDAKQQEDGDSAQLSLMVSRVEDLTLKLSAAEKQVRTLKQKLAKAESRDKRRSLSLKGRESFQICKELEEKLGELEAKVAALESGKPVPKSSIKSKYSKNESVPETKKESSASEKSRDSRIRRKSLDSATSSEPMKVLIRLSNLDSKITKCAEEMCKQKATEKSSFLLSSSFSDKSPGSPVRVSIEKVQEPMDTDERHQSEVFMRLHTLEDAILSSRNKVKECLNLVSSLKKFSPTKSQALLQSDSFIFLENYLAEVRETLQMCSNQYTEQSHSPTPSSSDVINSVQKLVRNFEDILQNKLIELCKKRAALRESGQLDEEARMRLLAEKMAYESVLISRIVQAVACGSASNRDFMKWMMTSELNDCNRLIASLKSKLDGSVPAICCETSVAYMTRVLSKKMLLQLAVSKYLNQKTDSKDPSKSETLQCGTQNNDLLEILSKQQQECEVCVNRYKKEKLPILAKALANETLSISSDSECFSEIQSRDKLACETLTLEDRRIREAWKMAQEAVNRELVHAEISHVTMRCGQAYEANITVEQETYFGFAEVHRSLLEQWCDKVEVLLRQEMEAGIEELTRKYEECLSDMKKEKSRTVYRHTEEDDAESRRLLFEFADIMAHKALVDARIAVIRQEIDSVDTHFNINPKENTIKSLLETDHAISDYNKCEFQGIGVEPDLVSEFEYLFQHFYKICCARVGDTINSSNSRTGLEDEIKKIMRKLSNLRDSLIALEDCLLDQKSKSDIFQSVTDSKNKISNSDLSEVCEVCDKLRQQVDVLTSRVLQSRVCQRCQQLQETLRRLNADHEEELKMLQHCQEQEMMRLREELEQQKHSLVSQHEQEQAQLKEKARRLERRLGTLDSEYSQQVENLRSVYQKTLSAGLERDVVGEENIRQRYQAEIEQLRALCEKGLLAMENSHRRIITELEEKHRQELQQMRLEKEQALAEETQATLAALDAMRKAHETEVQKEIAKFKEEFIKKMQSTHDIGALHKAHEEEMEEIKQEILSLSEKYSIKCVECASLDEQLVNLTKQLSQAQQQIQQLDARNKQLRAHLVSEASDIEVGNMAQLLREKSQELEHKYEEVEHLQQELASVNRHGAELSALCTQLSSEFACTDHDTSALLFRLQQMAVSWPSQNKELKISPFNRTQPDGITRNEYGSFRTKYMKEPSTLASAELIRSPQRSCSLTHNFLSVAPLHSPSLCSLSGMVAERKKVFEH